MKIALKQMVGRIHKASRDDRGISNVGATILLTLVAAAAVTFAVTWWKTSQSNMQNNIDNQQNSVFSNANSLAG